MFLFKRIFFTLLGALGTLVLDADPVYGLSKDEAVKKCEARITVLEQQKDRFGDKIAGVYSLVMDDLKKLVVQLKTSEEPPLIMSLYTTCQEGLTAVEWILNRYGKPSSKIELAKPDSVATPTPLVGANAPANKTAVENPAVVKPIVEKPPVTTRKVSVKKKVVSKSNVLKIKKRVAIKKPKLSTMKTRHRANRASRNIAKPA